VTLPSSQVQLNSGSNDGGFDLGSLVLLGNDIAMQWYAMAHDRDVPDPQLIPGTTIPTRTYNNTLLLIGVVVIAGVLLLKK
jgi:hypothetical protein